MILASHAANAVTKITRGDPEEKDLTGSSKAHMILASHVVNAVT